MNFTDFTEKYNIQLNEQQLRAVRAVDGPVLLLAVPGSGKTTVLVSRLGYMIYCLGIRPESILTVTYTVAATEDMRRRFAKIFGEEAWKFVGLLGVFTGFLITGYYAVISGWCLQYVYASIMGQLNGDADFVKQYFADFSSNPVQPLFWLAFIMLVAYFVIIHGVRGGIEKASR